MPSCVTESRGTVAYVGQQQLNFSLLLQVHTLNSQLIFQVNPNELVTRQLSWVATDDLQGKVEPVVLWTRCHSGSDTNTSFSYKSAIKIRNFPRSKTTIKIDTVTP